MIFIVVDLPAPLGPKKPKILPGATENDTSSSAFWEPYILVSWLTSRDIGLFWHSKVGKNVLLLLFEKAVQRSI
jgi:hypothetical protein